MKLKRAGGAFLALAAAALVGCGGDGGGPTITCDLAVMSVDVPDGAYDLTHSLDVSISTYNYGPDDCPSYTVALYLSHDIFVRALEDTLIGSESRTGGLASGAMDSFTASVSWSNPPGGSYFVGMIVTYAGDGNALNNVGYDPTPILISPGGLAAELYDDGDASNGFTPTTVTTGDGWSAWCDVRNGGDGDAGPFYVDFYASADTAITPSDHLLGSVLVSSGVSVGSYADADLSLVSFPSVPGGTYYVGWIIDAGGDIIESDEFNNTAYEPGYTLTVISDSDLEVLSVDAPNGSYWTTDSLSVSSSIRNNGPAVCSGYVVDLYLSTDSTITVSDYLIGSYSRAGGLGVGSTDTFSDPVFWDGMSPGNYYVGVIVTCADDPDTANNTGYDSTWITLNLVTDDSHEEDDNLSQAAAKGNFSELTNFTGISWDDDYFMITVTSNFNQIDITLAFAHAAGNLDLELLDGAGALLASSASSTDNEAISLLVNPTGGTHYIHVIPSGAAMGNSYTLWWDDTQPAIGDDAYEPNNSYLQAYDLTFSEDVWLSSVAGLGVQSDADWYEIYVAPGNERVIVDCTFSDAAGDIDIRLYNSLGDTFIAVSGSTYSASTSDNEQIDCVVPSSGTYYIRVYYGNDGNPYDLRWSSVLP